MGMERPTHSACSWALCTYLQASQLNHTALRCLQVWDMVPAALHEALEELVGQKDDEAVAEADVSHPTGFANRPRVL